MLKKLTFAVVTCGILAACASTPADGPRRRTVIRDCPVGTFLICETGREQQPSSGGDEEIPGYDRCYCRSSL